MKLKPLLSTAIKQIFNSITRKKLDQIDQSEGSVNNTFLQIQKQPNRSDLEVTKAVLGVCAFCTGLVVFSCYGHLALLLFIAVVVMVSAGGAVYGACYAFGQVIKSYREPGHESAGLDKKWEPVIQKVLEDEIAEAEEERLEEEKRKQREFAENWPSLAWILEKVGK